MPLTENCDEYAHKRIDGLESTIDAMFERQQLISASLQKNTELTQEVVKNTSDMVSLMNGAKVLRSLLLWMVGVSGAVFAIVEIFHRGGK